MAEVRLTVKTDDGAVDGELSVQAQGGEDLVELLARGGVTLNCRCGKDGSCGGCNLLIEDGSYEMRGKAFTAHAERHRNVLACQTHLTGRSATLRIPSRSRIEVSGEIESGFVFAARIFAPVWRRVSVAVAAASLTDHRSHGERLVAALAGALDAPVELPHSMLGVLPDLSSGGPVTAALSWRMDRWLVIGIGEDCAAPYAVAIDIGTTTVAGALVTMETGEILERATRYNQQFLLADDVAARISVADSPEMLERMQGLIVQETLMPVIDSLCHARGLAREDIGRVAIAGNTVMSHLALGLPVESIGRAPFAPMLRAPRDIRARDIRLPLDAEIPVDILPSIAGYVGGDITAGIFVSGLPARRPGTMLLDLGTNCEMVLRDHEGLVACATPAGPAFEGGGLSHGMRATDGAIAHVRIAPDGTFRIDSIGKRKPRGICGSAIIDFIAQGHRAGLINRRGRLERGRLAALSRLVEFDHGGLRMAACRLVAGADSETGSDVLVTERDISELLQAKSAVFSGMQTLLAHRGWEIGEIPELILAGGFARHVDIDNAITLGLFPDLPRERFTVLGNASLAGAYAALIDRAVLPAMRELHLKPEVIELNLIAAFEGNFIDGLYLPRPAKRQVLSAAAE